MVREHLAAPVCRYAAYGGPWVRPCRLQRHRQLRVILPTGSYVEDGVAVARVVEIPPWLLRVILPTGSYVEDGVATARVVEIPQWLLRVFLPTGSYVEDGVATARVVEIPQWLLRVILPRGLLGL